MKISPRSVIRKFFALSFRQKLILAETGFYLWFAWIVTLVPISVWGRFLGVQQQETSQLDDPQQTVIVKRIRWGIHVLEHRVPWRSDCLPQALAARMMLQWRRIPTTLYLGVAKQNRDGKVVLEAHAWLRSGTIIVTGAELRQRFKVVSTFAKDFDERDSRRL